MDNTTILDESAKNLLALLVRNLPCIEVGNPETYIGYQQCHSLLNLEKIRETHGQSLSAQGLDTLANWIKENNLPAITGMIINISGENAWMPSRGYFSMYGKTMQDFKWWKDEIEKSKHFDWSPYINDAETESAVLSAPSDFNAPEREDITTSRIIRDTALSAKIKEENNHACQLCGLTLDMPGNKKYAEVHHIKPLGAPHNGPDVAGNMICVCPNHHALLDYGAIRLENINLGHRISQEFIDYHNDEIYRL